MTDEKSVCDCPKCNCKLGEHPIVRHGKHYCCEACSKHHEHGEEAASAPTDTCSAGTWGLVRLHFQFQAVVVKPFAVAHGAGQASSIDPHHHRLGLLQVFRQWRWNADREAHWIIFDLFQADPAFGALGDAAEQRIQTVVQMCRAADECHLLIPQS